MTTIAATSANTAYNAYATAGATNAGKSSQNTPARASAGPATNVTFSDAAKAALEERTFAQAGKDARAALDKLLEEAELASPYKDGKLAIDLANLDRRELFAVATNHDGQFTPDEQQVANGELARRFDAALAGPAAVARVTDELIELYQAASDYLDAASVEEKATSQWNVRHEAVAEAIAQLTADPNQPVLIEGDPVADYMVRASNGGTVVGRDFNSIANDARKALDQQYANAENQGKELTFSRHRSNGVAADLTKFDSRTLSSIALNEGGQFSGEEIFAAKQALHTRSCNALLALVKNAQGSGDPTALAKSLIGAYGSLSAEERTATGWNESFYQNALLNYQSSAKIADMLGGAASATGGSLATMRG